MPHNSWMKFGFYWSQFYVVWQSRELVVAIQYLKSGNPLLPENEPPFVRQNVFPARTSYIYFSVTSLIQLSLAEFKDE